MTATRTDTHCQWVWVTINGSIAKTKQAAIAALKSSGIQVEERGRTERSWVFNPQTAIRENRTNKIYCAGDTERNFEEAVSWNGFWSGMWSHMWYENDQRISTCKLWHFEPTPFLLSRIVRDECTAWHKLWRNLGTTERNLGSTEKQIQCLILLDVEARIYEESEKIEVLSPSYPRSLHTVWISNNEQSVGQIRIHYPKPIAEILSSTHQAPWTQARMWTIQGHEAFENAQIHSGRHCPPLPQAMKIKNKGMLKVGVPSMQDLQKWAEKSQSSEDYKQLTLETFQAAPQWLAERRVHVK